MWAPFDGCLHCRRDSRVPKRCQVTLHGEFKDCQQVSTPHASIRKWPSAATIMAADATSQDAERLAWHMTHPCEAAHALQPMHNV